MIHTVVFDLGGVLVDFHPNQGIRKLGFSDEACKAFEENIFSGLWEACDLPPYSNAEIREVFKKAVPGFEKEVDYFWDDNHAQCVTSVREYTDAWLSELKAAGIKLYVLSNYGKESYRINSKVYDFLKYMDGAVISHEVGLLKPEADIYNLLCEKYGFQPDEAVFIDDREKNVLAAQKLGFQGIVFKNYEEAKEQLQRIIAE